MIARYLDVFLLAELNDDPSPPNFLSLNFLAFKVALNVNLSAFLQKFSIFSTNDLEFFIFNTIIFGDILASFYLNFLKP
jgi:hypothetical protein